MFVSLVRGWRNVWLRCTHCDVSSGYIESSVADQGRCVWRRQPLQQHSCCCQAHPLNRGCGGLFQRLWRSAVGSGSSEPCLLWRWVEEAVAALIAKHPPPLGHTTTRLLSTGLAAKQTRHGACRMHKGAHGVTKTIIGHSSDLSASNQACTHVQGEQCRQPVVGRAARVLAPRPSPPPPCRL